MSKSARKFNVNCQKPNNPAVTNASRARRTPKGIIEARKHLTPSMKCARAAKAIFGTCPKAGHARSIKLPADGPCLAPGVKERHGMSLAHVNALMLAHELTMTVGEEGAANLLRAARQGDVDAINTVSKHTAAMLKDMHQRHEEQIMRLKQGPENSFPPPAPIPEKPQEARVMLPDCFDAQVWAKEWLKTIRDNPGIPQDEGTMIAWFANALMAGHDNARRKYDRPQEVPVRDNILPLPQECRKAEANDCKKSSPMLEASDIVFKLLALVDDEVTFLGSKLQPVLGPEGPQSTGDAKCESACNSGLTETLRNYQRRLETIRQNMRNLRERVEV